MPSTFSCTTKSLIIVGSALLLAACGAGTTIKPGETVAKNANEASRISLDKIPMETKPASPQSGSAQTIKESGNTITDAATKTSHPSDNVPTTSAIITSIKANERLVNIRTAPSVKSRVIATLKGGHSIEIIETKENWVKVQWRKGKSLKQGWMSKQFAEQPVE